MRIPGFLGPTYPNRSVNFMSNRTINFYPELSPEPNEKSIIMLIGVPGMRKFIEVGSGPLRGAKECNGSLYVVSGSYLYRVDSTGVSQPLGTLGTAFGSVKMEYNGKKVEGVGGDQIGIVDGTSMYIFDVETLAFTAVNVGFPPSSIAYLDGYFIVTRKDSMIVASSAQYDGLTFPGIAVASINAVPGNVVGCCCQNQELWFIKSNSTELWYDTGVAPSSGFPLARVPGAVLNYGTPSPDSIVVGDNSVFMVGNARSKDGGGQFVGIVMVQGTTAGVISPPSINYQISRMSRIDDAYSFMFSMEGHTFVVFTFPTGNMTFIFDTTTQMWHERSTYKGNPYAVGKWDVGVYARYNGIHLVGDLNNGVLYEMDSSLGTESGKPIVSVRIAPHVIDPESMENVFIDRLNVDFEAGSGPISMSGETSGLRQTIITASIGGLSASTMLSVGVVGEEEPMAMLSFSKDGGHTWSNELPAGMGKRGDYSKRLVWRRLGGVSDRVFRLMMDAPVKKVVMGATMEAGL